MNRKVPDLICSTKGVWWCHLNPIDHSALVRSCGVDVRDMMGPMPVETELVPEFGTWLEANDPRHEARPCYGMMVLTFGGENEAMMFRLLTNAVVRRYDQ